MARSRQAPDEVTAKLNTLFGTTFTKDTWSNVPRYVSDDAVSFNAGHLFKACEILGCRPEQLFMDSEQGQGGGCETCAYEFTKLVLEVRS